jgi:hypothetical protein
MELFDRKDSFNVENQQFEPKITVSE